MEIDARAVFLFNVGAADGTGDCNNNEGEQKCAPAHVRYSIVDGDVVVVVEE